LRRHLTAADNFTGGKRRGKVFRPAVGTGMSRGRSGITDVKPRYIWRNMIFRNLGAGLSSILIREALALTYFHWAWRLLLSHGWVGARRDPQRQAVSMGSFPVNLFSRVGIALWGRDNAAWAQELGIAERTIRRYENGDMEPPEGVWRELLIRVQRVRDTWAYDQTEEDRWTELADEIKAKLLTAVNAPTRANQ
jgi:hypothetical protein